MKSPCVNICVIDPVSKFCIGCGRTGDEITGWINYSDKQRDEIMDGLSQRMTMITANRPRGSSRKRQRQRQQY